MKRNQGAHTAWAEMLSKGRVKAHRCGVHLTHSLFVTLQTCQRWLRGSLISTALVWAVKTRRNGSHLTIGVPPMARFNMYYRALDFLYTVEKGREKILLLQSRKFAHSWFGQCENRTFKKKPYRSYNFSWNSLINSPKTDVNLLKERIWRIPDVPRLRISKNDRYLIIGVPHRLHLDVHGNYIPMQLHFSIRNLKRPVTISVILASCSCHELEYPFTLALFKVEMGSLTVDAAQDFNAPSWSPTETIYWFLRCCTTQKNVSTWHKKFQRKTIV